MGDTGLRVGWEISPGRPIASRLGVEISLGHNSMEQGLAHGSVLAHTPGTLQTASLLFHPLV